MWYKDAIIYQIHVKAYCDSNGDGIGDFPGLISKLPYLMDLGITAIWLLPFYPSPLRDDGYDIADYYHVHPAYGTMNDFKKFLREAHRLEMRVITELVINHTSDQHPWFQRARKAKTGSSARDYYVWSNTQDKYKEVRIIFKDFEKSNWTWDEAAKMYYWHRFYSHQPDLNFDHPKVKEELFRVMDFWLKMGVDGLRLDAIPYLYEREGTNGENLPESHAFLQELRARVDRDYPDRMLLAEANQWPEDVVAYFGTGNECHMAFHFPVMPRLYMALQVAERFPIVNILEQTPKIPDQCQWATFLRNHDELTLEMVTDEERDAMYQAYAKDKKARLNLGIRRRLAPLLENDRRRIELLQILLLTLPGTPVLYYGDEIGMGDNYALDDRNGVRTPMQWNAGKNAGFSNANAKQLYLPVITDPEYHYTSVNVETQGKSPSSRLAWIKQVIAMRKSVKPFGNGEMHILSPDNPKIFAFIRSNGKEQVIVVVNLSRHAQAVDLDLSKWVGHVLEDIFSRSLFPPIHNAPYRITMGPHGYYILNLTQTLHPIPTSPLACPITFGEGEGLTFVLPVDRWDNITQDRIRVIIEQQILPIYLQGCRWFAGRGRTIHTLKIIEQIPIKHEGLPTWLTMIRVEYTEGTAEIYLLPLAFATSKDAKKVITNSPQAIIGRIKIKKVDGIIYDAVYSESFRKTLLQSIAKTTQIKGQRALRGGSGTLFTVHEKAFKKRVKVPPLQGEDRWGWAATHAKGDVLPADHSNTAILYGDKFFLKLYRRLEEGINPELEIGHYLTNRSYPHTPPLLANIEYRHSPSQAQQISEPIVIAVLQKFIPNQGDAWQFFLGEVQHYLERALAAANPVIGAGIIERAARLGEQTAELHLALSNDKNEFSPKPLTGFDQRSIYQALRNNTKGIFRLLRKNLEQLPNALQNNARNLLAREEECYERCRLLLKHPPSGMRIRTHGDYHLGQLLVTGNDFIVIDFEGEPSRPLSERRLKRSPLRDVAGMLRSFHYVASAGMLHPISLRPEDAPMVQTWSRLWCDAVSEAFLNAYLKAMGKTPLLPDNPIGIKLLLHAFLLDKAVYELGYEINHRPDWVAIPMQGIQSILAIDENAS